MFICEKETNTPLHAYFAGVNHWTLNGIGHSMVVPQKLIPISSPETSEMKCRRLASKLGQPIQLGVSWIQATRTIQSSYAGAGRENSRNAHETRMQANCDFLKCKVSLQTRGDSDQQIPDISFKESDLHVPVLKKTKARL